MWTDISPEKKYKSSISTWKDAWYPWPLGECKLKPHGYHYISDRMNYDKKDRIPSVDKDLEKLEPSYIAHGNIKWYS